MAHNYQLLDALPQFQSLGCPILVGVSRKSMIQKVLDVPSEGALNGSTALHAAAATGHAAVVEALLEAGANPQAAGRTGASPLQLAAAMGHVAAVRALVWDELCAFRVTW